VLKRPGMTVVLVFAVTLLVAMLLSELTERTVLSSVVLFLVVGFVTGPRVLGWMIVPEGGIERLAHFALVSVLFTDGMLLSMAELRAAWQLPGRALLFGMPLTMAATALAARLATGIPWSHAFLLGAILSPTDPVFASAIVGREEIPRRLRLLLNVESGVNDGLALPVVIVLLATSSGAHSSVWTLAGSLAGGIAIGALVPLAALALTRRTPFAVAEERNALFVLAIGLVVFAVAEATGANAYLAAFAAGALISNVRPHLCSAFRHSGDNISELLKLGAVMLFATLVSPPDLLGLGAATYIFAFVALFLARPFALMIALARSGMTWPERWTASWFGPKGFASIVYGLLVAHSGIHNATLVFHLAALVIIGSIVAHSSTDVPIARWFKRREEESMRMRGQT